MNPDLVWNEYRCDKPELDKWNEITHYFFTYHYLRKITEDTPTIKM